MGSNSTITHGLLYESDFLAPGWNAACTCGWTGENKPTIGEAEKDGKAHLEEAKTL